MESMPSWKEQKVNLKTRFQQLTDRDLDFDESRKREMFDNLQTKLGMTPNELEVIALAD
jgi:hypothetical protein